MLDEKSEHLNSVRMLCYSFSAKFDRYKFLIQNCTNSHLLKLNQLASQCCKALVCRWISLHVLNKISGNNTLYFYFVYGTDRN